MMRKFKSIAAAVAMMVSSAAMALPGASTAFTNGVNNKISDDFGEFLFVDGGTAGKIDAGDVFFTWLEINTFSPSGLAKTAVNELTLVAAIEVVSVIDYSLFPFPATTVKSVCGIAALSCAGITFKAPGLATWASIYGATGPLNGLTAPAGMTADTVGMIFEDSSAGGAGNFSLGTPSSGADGVNRMVVDLVAANGDSWTANGPLFLSDFNLPNGTKIGDFGLDLTISSQSFAGWDLGPNFTGAGVLFPDSNVVSRVGGDASFFFDAKNVPEPGTLALLGLAFAGLGLTTRRRSA